MRKSDRHIANVAASILLMSSMLQQLLFKPIPQPAAKGRLVRFGHEEPDIQLVTGTMEERIFAYLRRNQCPATAKEIAVGLGNNSTSRVSRTLQLLAHKHKLRVIKIEGCVAEYELADALS